MQWVNQLRLSVLLRSDRNVIWVVGSDSLCLLGAYLQIPALDVDFLTSFAVRVIGRRTNASIS